MMVDIVQANGCRVGNVHSDIERKLLYENGGGETITVQKTDYRYKAGGKAGHAKEEAEELVCKACRLVPPVGCNGSGHAIAHVIDGIRQVKLDFYNRFAIVSV